MKPILARYAKMREYPVIPCNLCGSQDHLQRQAIKGMLTDWEKSHPGRIASIFRALTQVAPSQLADRTLFDFGALETEASDHRWLPEGAVANINSDADERIPCAKVEP